MNKLLAISISSASIAIGAIPAVAEVDAKTHKLCLEAKDYLGCVKAMKGGANIEVEVEPVSGVGNSCPEGFAYVGTNQSCQRVDCKYSWWMSAGGRRHNKIIAGKSTWECPDRWVLGTLHKGVLTLNEVSPLINTPGCPPIKPEIGWNSSCETAPDNWSELEEAKQPDCNFKLHKYDCSFNAYLDANPAMKKWAELNPEMANKERIKLQSID